LRSHDNQQEHATGHLVATTCQWFDASPVAFKKISNVRKKQNQHADLKEIIVDDIMFI
jgi:hypothetical protein